MTYVLPAKRHVQILISACSMPLSISSDPFCQSSITMTYFLPAQGHCSDLDLSWQHAAEDLICQLLHLHTRQTQVNTVKLVVMNSTCLNSTPGQPVETAPSSRGPSQRVMLPTLLAKLPLGITGTIALFVLAHQSSGLLETAASPHQMAAS